MAAGLGFKTFTTGEVLTAGDVNGYLMQGINVFASSAARAAAITSPQEGQYSFLKDTNALEYYDGAAWVGAPVGDITNVAVTSPVTGGGSSGSVTIGIQDASTSQRGSVQLSDSTSTTSSVLAATPTAVKSSYDLAAAAIPLSTVTTSGDIIYATGSGAVTRRAIGSTGQVLTVSAGVPSWATPAATTPTFIGAMCQRDSGTISMSPSVRVAVPFTTEIADSNGFHDNTTNPSRFTIPTGYGGKYLLTAFGFLDVGSNSRFTLYYYKNGSDIGNQGIMQQAGNMNSNNQAITGSRQVSLVAGDYVELFIQNDNTASPTVYAAFYMTYLGA
jgi:hypothetical protein